ncbi:MAG: transcription antitermination factor NusB [Candidatus Gastranaerophilales bacterium]|nr:transcription antitermination factor NusB [Candidatus Gastranaerophilales bacterium]
MNKRRAARELALISFAQIEKEIKKSGNTTAGEVDIAEIIHKSTEVLTGEAENNLESAVQELAKIRDFIQNYEIEHPDNLERPYEVTPLPVNIPLTSDMTGRIDMALEAAEKIYLAIELTELAGFGGLDEVRDYAVKLVRTFLENKKTIDETIKKFSKGWDVERLVRIDRDILRIAITEMQHFEDVPISVSIDEAVELAKKYSEPESSGFINGILGQVAKDINFPSPLEGEG